MLRTPTATILRRTPEAAQKCCNTVLDAMLRNKLVFAAWLEDSNSMTAMVDATKDEWISPICSAELDTSGPTMTLKLVPRTPVCPGPCRSLAAAPGLGLCCPS